MVLLTPPEHAVVNGFGADDALWRDYCTAFWKAVSFVKARALHSLRGIIAGQRQYQQPGSKDALYLLP